MDNYIDILKKLNIKSKKNGDIPVSAIIIKNNSIIAKAYNKKYKNINPLDHAEIIAIKQACKKLKTTNLMDCAMLVTLKPCNMCRELIKEVRLKKIYYFVDNNKKTHDTTKYIKIDDYKNYFSNEIISFFKDKR